MSRWRQRLLVWLASLLTLALVAGGGLALWRVPQDAKAERLSARLERQIADYHEQGPVERPVLRGEPVDANAVEAQLEAVEPLASVRLPEEAIPRAVKGKPPAKVLRLAREHADALAAYRDAARRSWTWTEFRVEEGVDAPIPEYLPPIRAAELVLVRATTVEPAECLRDAADVVRLAHDLVPGASLVAAMVSVAIIEQAASVVVRCAHGATPATLNESIAELERLREASPDIGGAIEAEALLTGMTFREVVRRVPWIPTNGHELQAWWARPDVLDAWQIAGRDPARFREITTDGYPGSAEIWGRAARVRKTAKNPVFAIGTPDLDKYIHKHMDGVARLRAALAALRILERRPDMERLPEGPLALERPELFDPYTGQSMAWSVDRTRGVACIHAQGPNRDYDGCGPGTDDPAVRLRLDMIARETAEASAEDDGEPEPGDSDG